MKASFVFVVTFCVLLEFLIIFTKSKTTAIKGRSCDINCTSRIIIRSSDIYNPDDDNQTSDKKGSKEKEEDFAMNLSDKIEARIEIETEERAKTKSKLEIAEGRHLKRGKYYF